MKGRPSFGARKTLVDGILFDSGKEARRFAELRMLERAGEIRDLETQPKFVLQAGFRYKGRAERAVTYTADFAYTTRDGRRVVEDVKGVRTEAYRIRRRLFLFLHPEVDFLET